MNTTVRVKASQIYKDWHVIDAADRPLGRVASEAATLLRGKHKPTFERHLDGGDFVIIVNASKVRVTGRKEHQIKYYTHSGYPGGLRVRSYADQLARFPDRIIQQAVWGMLPGGALGKKVLRHLKVYAGPNHPHASQIASTQKAQADRAEAQDALRNATFKAPRLRPLSVPQAERAEEQAPVAEAAPERPARRSRGKASRAAAVATTAAELEAAAETVLTTETTPPAEALLNEETVVAENATPAEAAIEQGEPLAEAKPRRSRKAAAPEAVAESAPRPRARKKATTAEPAESPAAPKKPTTRRRSAPKTEE
jgi:large subunit ribosomal protein L13